MASFFTQAYNKVTDKVTDNMYNNPSSMYPIHSQPKNTHDDIKN